MATSLSFLAAEVVGQILSYSETSHCSILLWKCGDFALQRKIKQGVTIVELRSHNPHVFCRAPSMLLKLRSLRELRIDRGDIPLQHPTLFASMLPHLSPTLVKLELTFEGANRLFSRLVIPRVPKSSDLPQSDSADASSTAFALSKPQMVVMDTAKHFPKLETLHVFAKASLPLKFLGRLPPTITELGLGFGVKNCVELMAAVPRTVEKLVITLLASQTSADLKVLSQLPPNVTDVDFKSLAGAWSLPVLLSEACTTLPFGSIKRFTGTAFILGPGLPEFLETLNVASNDVSALDWSLLPRHLTSLVVPTFMHYFTSPEELRQLPRTLRMINCPLNLQDAKPEDLPPRLTAIDGRFEKAKNFVASVLPASLRSLVVRFDYTSHTPHLFSDLPSGITELDLPFGKLQSDTDPLPVLKLPSSLTSMKGYLDLPRDPRLLLVRPCETFSLLPSCTILHEILLPKYCFPLSALRHLPRSLISLEIGGIFKDAHFDAIAMYEEKKIENGFVETTAFRRNETTFLDLLPKTMKKLVSHDLSDCFLELPSKAWRRAPHFETLEIAAGKRGLNADFLLHMRTDCLKRLFVKVDKLRDDHVSTLKREMTLNIEAETYLLTEACIPRWPLSSSMPYLALRGQHYQHMDAVRKAIEQSDLTTYYQSCDQLLTSVQQ